MTEIIVKTQAEFDAVLARVQQRIKAAEERVENLRIRAAYLKAEARR